MNEMTPRERVSAAIGLQAVDRVPVIPKLDLFCLPYRGMKVATEIRDGAKYRQALEDTFEGLGGFDAVTIPGQFMNELGFWPMGAAAKLPGYQLSEDELWQMDEQEVMGVEDYGLIAEHGWKEYLAAIYPKLGYSVPWEAVPERLQHLMDQKLDDIRAWEEKDIPVYQGPICAPAFELITFSRSLRATLLDVRRCPELVFAAIGAIEAENREGLVAQIQDLRDSTKYGAATGMIGATRPSFLRPEHFEKFFWEYLKKTVDLLIEQGFSVNLHFDGDWTRYLEYFLELPRGQVVLDLDGATDIAKAKQILSGHMCIMGDVPAGLLALGEEEEVVTYCRNLIDVVGADGGFILSSGCSIPLNAKAENVRAMIDTAKTYYPHA